MTAETLLKRLHIARGAVAGSPFYTAEQKEAVAFTLDLVEFGEVRTAQGIVTAAADETTKAAQSSEAR